MSELRLKSTNQILLSNLTIATTFKSRGVGLLGMSGLNDNQGLWIHKCNSIHTFFMKFTIDCIFVDQNLKIKSLKSKVSPWKVIWPQWNASSVFEVNSGFIERTGIKTGDGLYVVP